MKIPACCILLFSLGLVSFGVFSAKAQGPSGYHVAKKLVLGGEGGWDYLTVDSDARRVYLSRANGKVVTTLPIGSGTDASGFDPSTGFAFSSNGEGTLTVVHEDSPDKFSVVENVPTQVRARTMALDAKTHQVYLVTAEFGPTPAPTTQQPRPRPPVVPGTFTLLIMSR